MHGLVVSPEELAPSGDLGNCSPQALGQHGLLHISNGPHCPRITSVLKPAKPLRCMRLEASSPPSISDDMLP